MDNITEILTNTSWGDVSPIDCNDLTNNGLYFIFTGYLIPLLSPNVRSYFYDKFLFIKNAGKTTGKIVSVSEYGFKNIQKLSDNTEMLEFIERVARNNNIEVIREQIMGLAWSFSGDTDNGKKESREETWSKLMKELDRIHDLNVLDKSKIKP